MYEYEKLHVKALRKYLGECMVLLKCDGAFPLTEAGKIAAYGSGVRKTIKGGTGSGEVNSRFFFNVEEGLQRCGFTVTTGAWLDAYEQVVADAKAAFTKELKAKAKAEHKNAMMMAMGAVMPAPEYDLPLDAEGDAAIYVLSRISGEGNDRQAIAGDIALSDTEIREILTLQENYEKFMLVLNVGGPVDLTPVMSVGNILLLSQLGVETGYALGQVLLGKQNPSGKLTTTWSAWEDYCSIGSFGDYNDTRYTEGIYVGYRYFDTVGKKALFPFGYGCSYTSFKTEPGSLNVSGQQITVSATVTNTGCRAGKEVVQLYVSAPWGKLDKAYQELAGWAKTRELAAGESQTVSIRFAMSDLASYDEEAASWILEKGAYILRLGNSSADTQVCGAVILAETVTTLKARNVLGTPDFEDWKPEMPEAPVVPEHVPVVMLDAESITGMEVNYEQEEEIDPAVEELTNEELAHVNVGGFDPSQGPLSIIGNASIHVPGAAGETTSLLTDRDFPALVMADGPAGLRLSRHFFADKKGLHSMEPGLPESMVEMLPKPVQMILKGMTKKPKKGAPIYEQYCTAIPIGTAIAQSFNTDFAKLCGDIVGDEMERMGVHLWLAPALNIHRSILCGRNFEYFSEDPVVSGKFAAAITLGVQAHSGRGTTIKHYAANNQEHNRYNNNSQASERAMREIYLKGFGICVRESQPHALMTSYNLLNGEHTSESRGLIMDILRSEFGYQGIVMTDWILQLMSAKDCVYRSADGGHIAAAGGDLVMPGGKGDVKSILKALEEGLVSREQLMINATRVYRMAHKLADPLNK